MIVLGISGKKGSGKTTIAEYLRDELTEFHTNGTQVETLGFSHIIKSEYIKLFNESLPIDLDSQAEKNKIGIHGKTHRQAIQEFGVAMRAIDPNIWIRLWRDFIDDFLYSYDILIVPDVRFPNEVKAIHDMGGKVIRLTRCPHPEDTHESETALDYMLMPMSMRLSSESFDIVIDNAHCGLNEQNKIALDYVRGLL